MNKATVFIPRKHEMTYQSCVFYILNSLSFPKDKDELFVEVIKLLRRYRYNLDAISEDDDGVRILFYFKDESQAKSFLDNFSVIAGYKVQI